MKREKIFAVTVISAAFILMSGLAAWGQGYTGGFKGKVQKNYEPAKNLQVIVSDPNTGRQFKTKTDKNGEFTVVGLQPGGYVIEILGENKEVLYRKQDGVQADLNLLPTIELTRPEASGGTAGGEPFSANAKKSK
ncbi:MAG TPA: carboxypeptidase-like regulatory domain-containing protein, partial [Verrucomicrobiae bacterium]|nr:carboxypeptidase-like regulatory domain-containing protein [Verrucomicrobiae bacterium]